MYPNQLRAFEQEYAHIALRVFDKQDRYDRAMRVIEKRYNGDEKNAVVARLKKLQETEV